jgi:predicted RNA-binding protein with PIN domain
MRILIDGYNLLHASGVFGDTRGPGGFEASRRALLEALARLLGEERRQTTIVFDAAEAPPGLPGRWQHDGIDVIFARDHASADALIENLIEDHRSPTSLTVVSSDNRVIAAARRRRAKAIGSSEWFAERRAAARAKPPPETKPPEPSSDLEVDRWLREFGF